jgi:endonuclease YncB( thermonuclease family)
MRRRDVLKGIGAGAGAASAGLGLSAASTRVRAAETIAPLYFDSTTGLLNEAGEPLTDDSLVSVYAHDSATAEDSDGDGDATSYGSDPLALAATDGAVVALGCPFVTDDTDFSYGNEEFMLNVWDEVFESGTVLWDEGHEQYYHLGRFGDFEGYAESHGYTVEATTSMESDLEGAAGIVITTPTGGLSDSELSALSTFVSNGGGVILHSQSDYRNFDATENSNEILAELGADIRFNDAQIMDAEHGPGPEYILTTDQFNTEFPYFETREGIGSGPRFDIGETYEATVESIADGDTFTVSVEGGTEEIRVLGVDTTETAANAQYEMPHEWPGLADEDSGAELDEEYSYLAAWAEESTSFARSEIGGETVTLSFDENEGITDPFGRLLAYVTYDKDGSGSRDTLYAKEVLRTGHGRAFHSGPRHHDEFLQTELAARESGTGMWAESDLSASSEYRNRPVESVFVPNPAPVGSQASETLAEDRAVVRAPESASQPGAPLLAIDREARLAAVGGLMISDSYQPGSEFAGDATKFENFTLLTNVLAALSDREGAVLVAGGKGQFDADGSLTAEATSFYQRHLEGGDMALEGVNDLTSGLLDRARAVIITPHTQIYQTEELDALRTFREDGGAVILMGSGAAAGTPIANLNNIAALLDSDLRVGRDALTDTESNLADDERMIVTDRFAENLDVYQAYASGEPSLGDSNTTAAPTTEGPATTTAPPTTSGDAGPGLGVLTGVLGIAGGLAAMLRSAGSGDD